MRLEHNIKPCLMSETMNSFLSELALAKFNADIEANESRIKYIESAIKWEKKRQSLRSTLSVIMEQAHLTRREVNFVMCNIMETTIDGLLEKIRFVSSRIPESPDPEKQFIQRCKFQ